ncbi:MAG: zf-TFIIB domain-containing protein [Thiotrichales bacterium]
MFLPLALTPELRPLLDQIIRQASDWPRSSLACPQCGRSMHVAHYDAVEIDLCRHCQAVWLDKGEVDRVTTRLNDEAQEQAKDEATHAAVDELSRGDLAGTLDWLGDALGALLSP